MSKQTLHLDELIDPFEARVVVENRADGSPAARFDLSGLPRLDAVLIGQPVAKVPDMVKRLCGICPVPHHLAGVRALETLLGYTEIPAAALAIRQLLSYGAMIDALAPRFLELNRESAMQLRRFGKAVLAAAGCPGHFPDVAIPGGVRALANPAAVTELAGQVGAMMGLATNLVESLSDESWVDEFVGADLGLSNGTSADPLGELALVGPRQAAKRWRYGRDDWPTVVVEEVPGAAAPRPLIALGPGRFTRYRVGSVAKMWAVPLAGAAGSWQRRWCRTGGSPKGAAAIGLLDAVEWVQRLVTGGRADLVAGSTMGVAANPTRIGVGWVDGPRGLLVHRYTVDADEILVDCQILTPTAQNEPWLAEMLSAALIGGATDLEGSVRAADPCLPCVSAPLGQMGLVLSEEESHVSRDSSADR